MKVLSTFLLLCSAIMAMAQPAPQQGGSITLAIAADPPGFDPTVSTSQEIARVFYNNVYEGLVKFDRHGAIIPALAERWDISEDALTWTFHLRPEVHFHNGDAFSAADVIAKFERARDPDSGHTNHQYYSLIREISANEAGDAVMISLEKPHASFLYDLARPDSIIYPASLQASQRTTPIGTGPFQFVDYVEGSAIRLERFNDYYHAGLPYLDTITFKIIPDENTRLSALRSGELDITNITPEAALQLQGNSNIKLTTGDATAEVTLALNNSHPALSNRLVRQAISHAINKEVIVQGAMFGYGTPIGTHMTPAESYFIEVNPYPYNPERARELLAEAGYGAGGLSLDFALPAPYPLERRTGQVIAQQLEEVGITVNVSVVEWGTWIERIFSAADYDMTIIGHAEPRDIAIYANPDYYYRYDNQVVQDLVEAAEGARSSQAQDMIYGVIGRIIADDAVNVWVFSPPYLLAAKQDIYGYWTDLPTPVMDMTEVYWAE